MIVHSSCSAVFNLNGVEQINRTAIGDDVEKYLVGTSIYFDTSFSFDFMEKEQFISIIKNHKKIVFGTDSPWESQKKSIDDVLSCGFDEEFLNNIMY